jgi:hypothetical protein
MATTQNVSKMRKVINYLANGKTLTPNQARARFGVRNLRATISDIREVVTEYGNWQIVRETTAGGKTCYGMRDVHPGRRRYAFRADGTRYAIR